MKFPSIIVAVLTTVLFSINSFAQQCFTGQCYKSAPMLIESAPSFTVAVPSFTPVRSVVHEVVVQPTQNVVEYFQEVQPVRSVSVAAFKTSQQVSQGVMRHVGGTLGGARYEGVGFSTYSPEDALRRCCYSNRPRREQSVQYGYNRSLRTYGWFATILCD